MNAPIIQNVDRKDRSSGLFPLVALWFILTVATAYFSTALVQYTSQLIFTGTLLAIAAVLRIQPDNRLFRVSFLLISTFIVMRYFFWRTLYTVEFTGWDSWTNIASFACALILYFAEVYGIMIFMLGQFVNIWPIDRKPAPLPPEEEMPTVDVYIPTYNESPEILEVTVMASIQMRYPKDKLRVYICDDGGTDQKCESTDPKVAEEAKLRKETLTVLADELGVSYLTRSKNLHAKAGNLNEAFHKTTGDLVVIFDADHVPTEDFLEKTVGLFHEDPKLFLVQTPHFFVNPDPIEKNLETFYQMPSENEMFYRVVQRGLDFWNSSFFCGSGAVMRRRCLMLTNGLSGDTITEDAETALTLHSKGFNSAYISTPLLSGLSPETMSAFIGQRIRWATGMVQIFLLKCPLFLKGLSFPQRLCYFNSCFFWFFPLARIVYLLAPVAFLFFGLKIYAANWQTFLSYVAPYLFAVFTVSHYLYGKVRWAFVSELYELIQSVYTLPAIISTFLNPRKPQFKVTAKGEVLDRDFISPLIPPFYILAGINLACVVAGFSRLTVLGEDSYPVLITLFWSLLNSVLLLASLGAMFERRQRRAAPRMPSNINARVLVTDGVYPCRITDLSLGGVKLAFKGTSEAVFRDSDRALLEVEMAGAKRPAKLHLLLRNIRTSDMGDELNIGGQFDHKSLEERKMKVRLVTGSSMRWMEFQKRRESRLGVIGSFAALSYIGLKHSLLLLTQLATDSGSHLSGRSRRIETQSMDI